MKINQEDIFAGRIPAVKVVVKISDVLDESYSILRSSFGDGKFVVIKEILRRNPNYKNPWEYTKLSSETTIMCLEEIIEFFGREISTSIINRMPYGVKSWDDNEKSH